MNPEHRDPENERDIRLKTMLVMTGMDHLVTAMEQQRTALEQSDNPESAAAQQMREQLDQDFISLFNGLLEKFNAIDDKLRSIQTAHFALQHSCSSATEVAQTALRNVQRGNPYLSKIDDILSYHSELDTTEAIINSATDMIKVARRDTEHVLSSLRFPARTDHKHQSTTNADAPLVHHTTQNTSSGDHSEHRHSNDSYSETHHLSPALLGV